MRYRWFVPAALSFVAAVIAATAIPAIVRGSAASQAEDWTVARTPWGDPDLQGIWTNETTGTPRQRPARFGEREFLNDEEIADLERQARERYEAALAADNDAGPRSAADVARTENTIEAGIYGQEYNNVWMEQPREPGPLRWTRTSLIVEPSHGQIPPYTPELIERVEASRRGPAASRRGGYLGGP